MQPALALRGVRIISGEHGALLGRLCMVYVDARSNCIAAFSYRTGRVGGRELCVSTDQALTITDDVIVISSAAFARPISHNTLPGPSLTQLLGCRVSTVGGHHLGRLADLLFANDWSITGLLLDDRRRLALHAHELSIGEELLVPDYCADDLTPASALFGSLNSSGHEHEEHPAPSNGQRKAQRAAPKVPTAD